MASEKRLIDANEYCRELYRERDYPGRTQEFMDAIETAITDLCDMPTVDAVEVVRCKDCRRRGSELRCPMCFEEQYEFDEGDGYMCIDYRTYDRTKDNGYCDRGERKER